MKDYRFSFDRDEIDIQIVHEFLTGSYWAKDIPYEIVKRSIENSLCFGAFHLLDGQVAFGRFITDRATFAYLADVFVLDAHRGQGVGIWLVNEALKHPDIVGLRSILLATSDAHGLYQKCGFLPPVAPDKFMALKKLDPYQ